jgi:hypothetical protein
MASGETAVTGDDTCRPRAVPRNPTAAGNRQEPLVTTGKTEHGPHMRLPKEKIPDAC